MKLRQIKRRHAARQQRCRPRARDLKAWVNDKPVLIVSMSLPGGPVRDTGELERAVRIEGDSASGTLKVHVDGSNVSAAALIAMADELPGASGKLHVALTPEQRERAMRTIERVLRDDPRRFSFSLKLPRR
jgi:hypothetical protein